MSIEKTTPSIFLSMTAYTNIIIYFYSKIRNVGGRSFFNENPYYYHTNFVTFQDIENNQEYKPKHNKS